MLYWLLLFYFFILFAPIAGVFCLNGILFYDCILCFRMLSLDFYRHCRDSFNFISIVPFIGVFKRGIQVMFSIRIGYSNEIADFTFHSLTSYSNGIYLILLILVDVILFLLSICSIVGLFGLNCLNPVFRLNKLN